MPKQEEVQFQNIYKKNLAQAVQNNQTIEPGSAQEKDLLALVSTDYGKEKLGYSAYEKALAGDFSSFEKVSPPLRNYLASKVMHEMDETHRELLQRPLSDPDLQQLLEENAMNPAFRLGCSLRQHTGKSYDSKKYLQFDDFMNSHVMQQTLRPMDKDQLDHLKTMTADQQEFSSAVSQNIEKQVMVARTLFLAHIGNTTLETAPNKKETINRSMASMAAHCSRTAYVFKPGSKENVSGLMDAVTGKGLGDAAGVTRRTAATHSVKNGKTIQDFKEKKVFPSSFTNQHGMDIAIGGLGNPGIPGPGGNRQILKNDGSCGHMYMRADAGGPSVCTSLLIGFESDSPSAAHNQQGHEHTITAKPEYMSSFLGQRTDEMGAKYGGRVVDCTSFDVRELTNSVNDFSNYYRAMLVEGIKNEKARSQIELANTFLCGVPMDSFTLSSTLTNIGMPLNRAKEITASSIKARNLSGGNLMAAEESSVKVDPQPEPPVPGRWTRFKARLGIDSAKKSIEQYQEHCQRFGNVTPHEKTETNPEKREWIAASKSSSIQNSLNNFSTQLFKSGLATTPPARQMTVQALEKEHQMEQKGHTKRAEHLHRENLRLHTAANHSPEKKESALKQGGPQRH